MEGKTAENPSQGLCMHGLAECVFWVGAFVVWHMSAWTLPTRRTRISWTRRPHSLNIFMHAAFKKEL